MYIIQQQAALNDALDEEEEEELATDSPTRNVSGYGDDAFDEETFAANRNFIQRNIQVELDAANSAATLRTYHT
jgi:hypothetical protein